MSEFNYKGKTYEIDSMGFLLNFNLWDENYAEGVALQLNMPQKLTKMHWKVIRFIRLDFMETGKCPLVYKTCKINNLKLKDLKMLFPSGYLRGACRLAGITYKEGYLGQPHMKATIEDYIGKPDGKTYQIDVRGFLVNPEDWDENYARHRAQDMKIPEGELTEKHWEIIRYLRASYARTGIIPTIYETCEANNLELEDMKKLFPDGYHRGAVKIAGLKGR